MLMPGLKQRIQLLVITLSAALIFGRPAAADSPFTVDVWSTADRLPENTVIALTQTRDGYLWAGTQGGLARFDGNSFTPINVNNAPGLPDNRIVYLFQDSKSNLWIATGNGRLCALRQGEITQFDVSAAGGKIIFAEEDASGTVGFLTFGGRFFTVTGGQVNLQASGVPRQVLYRYFHILLMGKNGVVWQLQNGRLLKFHGNKLGKDFGATPWTPVFSPLPGGDSLPIRYDANVTAFCEDREGNLVVGTHDAGVYWFDATNGYTHISTDKGVSHNSVLSLCCDHDGNIWVGTDGDGLERVTKKLFTEPPGYSPGVAVSSAEDDRGGVWTAFNRRGLTYVRTNTATGFQIGTYGNAWSVLVDAQQEVWAGTRDEGLFHLENNGFTNAIQPLGGQISVLFQSRDGRLWVGGRGGLAGHDEHGWRIFSAADGLPSGAIRALAEDTTSNLWIGTESAGLFILRDGRIINTNAPVKDISCLLCDRDGVLWVGTSGHGLARFAQGQWAHFASSDGLTVDDIGYLLEDDATNLWIGSYEGLMRVERMAVANVAPGTARRISCRTFLTQECTVGAQPAAIHTRDGRLLFPTEEGIVSVNPADLRPNTNPPPVVIESVLVDGVPQQNGPLSAAWPQAVVLRPENEQLEIHFTALNFSAPKGVQFGARFKYQLTAWDKKPTDIGGERVAHFGRLSPGNYVFHVTACNEDGYWNETGATLAITVEPPFWRQPWFITAGVLALLGALAGTIYLISTARLRRQLRLAQQKEMIEHERARIARDLHDQLGANLTQITLLGEMAETDKEVPAEIEEHSRQICATARDTTRSLDEIVWAVNPSNDTLEGLVNYACKYAQDYFAMAGVSYRAELPPGLPPIPILPEVRHNVFLAFKEAVNNVVKHAHATEAHVKLQLAAEQFILSVSDNGRGVGSLADKNLRNGLKNMRRRLDDVHGQFDIAPAAGGGTVVKLTVPINGGMTKA